MFTPALLHESERLPEAKFLNLAEAAPLTRCSRTHFCNIVFK